MIEMSSAELKTSFGNFNEKLFSDGNKNIYVLVKGNIKNKENILCRIHSHCVSAHYFFGIQCDCNKQMIFSQKVIEKEEIGVIIWLEQEGRGNGHYAKMLSEKYKKRGLNQADAYIKAGYPADNRSYYEVKTILDLLDIKSIVLISSNSSKQKKLQELGVNVISTIDFNKCIIESR